jgi:hypothetical protein
MTSFRQIEANRRNALRSTGPVTEDGKQRSRRNAIRHGLCAETVIAMVEDTEDYAAFEAAIIADYDARTAVERELVLRLASLLWRLRRSTAIETDLFRIQAEILRDRRDQAQSQDQRERPQPMPFRLIPAGDEPANDSNDDDFWRAEPHAAGTPPVSRDLTPSDLASRDFASRDLAYCFQRLANFDNGLFERLGRYETALWRQMVQTYFLLQSARRD